MSGDDHKELMRRLGVPASLLAPPVADRRLSSTGEGELPGLRDTIDGMVARGESRADALRAAKRYERDVRSGAEPYPVKR